ncbi:transcription factor BIM2-like isoform X1 [Camellia sinensis]|uniref:transcription factor BIM2-like isoform X1 n=2 Tax=Camellia sinensis TaxID=4442 RepID=UPI001036CED5|nr:transcription factor BIM2-like isoform X1 [Camellia sinensis]
MKSAAAKGQQHEEEEEDDDDDKDLLSKNRDGKNNDKVNSIRSKHSVTEQRRRSKINERFQMLRNLIPHSDQKRDTASFLLEVIEYVQYLQEKVQKYEGSYQGLNSEPTKLMPWRNSHWRIQSFVGHTQAIKNDSGPCSTFPGRFDENNITTSISPVIHPIPNPHNPIESDNPSRDPDGKPVEQQPVLPSKSIIMPPMPMPLQASVPASVQGDDVIPHPLQRPISDARSTECPIMSDALSQQEELMIEGGTISITSIYSQGLLNNLTQALQSAGVDLSQATASVQIELGKRANRGVTSGVPIAKDPENTPSSHQPFGHFRDASNGEDLDQAQKRLKI